MLYGDRMVVTETYKGTFLWQLYDEFLYISLYGCGNSAMADELLVAAEVLGRAAAAANLSVA